MQLADGIFWPDDDLVSKTIGVFRFKYNIFSLVNTSLLNPANFMDK